MRSARFCPAKARFETTWRYSSFFRKSSSKRRAMVLLEMEIVIQRFGDLRIYRFRASEPQISKSLSPESLNSEWLLGRDRRQQLIDDRVRVDLLGFTFEVEQDAVTQGRERDGANVVD